MKGVAPIKAEYLKKTVSDDDAITSSAEKRPRDDEHQPAETENGDRKKRRKGQNKNREKFSDKRKPPEERLCKAIICGTVCSYGDSCKFFHDVKDFLSKKPADIAESCYNFATQGRCPYGFACRYGGGHIKESADGGCVNVEKETIAPCGTYYSNGLPSDVITQLRKRQYDFGKATIATRHAKEMVDKIVKKNVELNSTKKSKDGVPVGDSEELDSAALEMESSEKQTEGEPAPIPSEPTEQPVEAAVGPLTNEDQFSIKPGEKKTIDFKNKLYLAPLTTVGNLPFRRLCKRYGAEITCGEMALATKLLQGVTAEWALVKRHSSEDIFGVQLCGAYADSMAKCTQLLNETCNLDFIDINVGCPIDLIFDQGAGSALMRRVNRFHEIVHSMVEVSTIPITAKIRTGVSESKSTAHTLLAKMKDWGLSLTTLHGRSREQRYTKLADWDYIDECAQMARPMPLYGGGDILSFEDYNKAMATNISGVMIARGALIKPWIFTEIKEQRHWDISSNERLDILKDFTNYGLEHWGSDQQGVETTRRFLLEWLSFLHRYIPVGLLERVPQKVNERPQPYVGRDDLETLMASPAATDWVKISEMLLGPVPEGFFFIPKHKASSYS